MIAVGCAVIAASIVVIVVTLHIWTQAGAGPEGGGGQRRNEGGAVPPQPGSGGTGPGWWPEFERQFASYLGDRDRERQPPAVRN